MPQRTPSRADADPGVDRGILLLAAVVVLGAIMTVLDTTIVNVALDTLGRDFSASLSTVQWVATGYMLALATVIPMTGWGVERFGAKRLWITSVLLFVVGSLLSAASWSIGSLIAFRVLQGLGGGMIMPAGHTILAQAAGPRRMGRVLSVGVGVPMLLGPVLGPVLGGVLIDVLSWRWIFLVNLPIGGLALLLAARLLPASRGRRERRLDVRGLLLLSPGLAMCVYALAEIGIGGSIAGAGTLATLVFGPLLVAGFAAHALRRGRDALIDLRLFRDRSFAAAAGTAVLFGITLFGMMILLPLYFQIVRREGPLATGLLVAPQGVGVALAMPVAGRLTDRLGAGRVVPVGLLFAVAGTLGYALLGADTSYVVLVGALVVRGIGLGSTMMPAMAAAYQALDRDEVPRATTALNIVQRLGGSIGTALLAVILERRIEAELPATHGDGLGALHSAVASGPEGVAGPLADAFAQTFWVALGLTAFTLVPALFLPRLARRREGRRANRYGDNAREGATT